MGWFLFENKASMSAREVVIVYWMMQRQLYFVLILDYHIHTPIKSVTLRTFDVL